MELNIVAVLGFLCQIPYVSCLDCYECYDNDYRSCDYSLEKETCRGNGNQCYSLRYYEVLDKGLEEHGFRKGCLPESVTDCNAYCETYIQMGHSECKIHCCEGDTCNKDGFKDLADQNKKIKRSSKRELSGSSNSSIRYRNNLTFIAFFFLFTLRFALT